MAIALYKDYAAAIPGGYVVAPNTYYNVQFDTVAWQYPTTGAWAWAPDGVGAPSSGLYQVFVSIYGSSDNHSVPKVLFVSVGGSPVTGFGGSATSSELSNTTMSAIAPLVISFANVIGITFYNGAGYQFRLLQAYLTVIKLQ
jgi:hypothetical protein